ncbi:uncharacterized protein LOC116778142 isoform X2 [Danaus plexippus]|uniref:uncharacterized protein LOC116778142 isoform X2 n=1 Tax=Danaus plexippus TaxID=13037 RepID=UPI0013C52A5F|nr:uncharacterized protein LOC116778142 isoform X2 [Danaus plexippus]
MDASASNKTNPENNLYDLYLKIENPIYSARVPYNKPVVKYTRLPDFDLNTKALWSPQYISLEPRLRRIITIEEPKETTHRSLRSNVATPGVMTSKVCKRKIVTIEEESETNVYPKFYSKDTKCSVKYNMTNNKKETTPKFENKYKYSRGDNSGQNTTKYKEFNDNESTKSAKSIKSAGSSPKFSLSKKLLNPKENEKECTPKKNKLKEYINIKAPPKTVLDKTKRTKSPPNFNRNKMSLIKDIKDKVRPVSVIHVPLDDHFRKRDIGTEASEVIMNQAVHSINNVTTAVQAVPDVTFKDVEISTNFTPEKVNQMTSVDEVISKLGSECKDIKDTYDSLEIPNVSLINSKTDSSKDLDIEKKINNIPNSYVKEEKEHDTDIVRTPNIDNASSNVSDKDKDTVYHKSTSYIIGRATLTYTTRQKINFHLVENNEVLHSRISPRSLNYPLNVVSVLKKEISNQKYNNDDKLNYNSQDSKSDDETETRLTPINRSYALKSEKLVKPSDIISTIKLNNNLLHRDLCGQFQRELNFIDSFFESLQYLDSCSLSDRSITEKKVENWISGGANEVKNFEFGSFLSQFENEFNIDNPKTMASESLCLLNFLIQNEQIKAEYLLDALKMREDALKHFTKSQILWLEDKKKHDHTDIPTLKKKQRGAIIKLQHECGEMQRMRKALLALSEQRKLALKKTKKNIELKLRNSSDVEQIILGKKKLRRNVSTDRNNAPLKCFELSSSGCDDSTTSRPKSNASIVLNDLKAVTSAEKCVQTGESLPLTSDQSTNTFDENFVVVDGSYLNIVFQNLSPQIFSAGKQYEVNKDALKNIVDKSNMHNINQNNEVALEEFMDHIKNHELESSSPSTARSLVDEFDQIYKTYSDDDISYEVGRALVDDIKEVQVSPEAGNIKNDVKTLAVPSGGVDRSVSVDECCSCEPLVASVGIQVSKGKEVAQTSVTGPLPIPAGAASTDDVSSEVATWLTQRSSVKSTGASSSSSQSHNPSISSLSSPVQYEAEELRRQQLAIEREIKALEQQQCQLLALREIPDKPPPPYTPPTEPRPLKSLNKFIADDINEQKIHKLLFQPGKQLGETDVFEVFVKDFCQESIERQKLDRSDKYWDTCNMIPVKPKPDKEKLVKKAAADLKEVLSDVPPTVVSGVGARRSDHIDDILFAEWRRCEPEWTSLHADEVIVKNQVFESIFQKILSETVDEYKRTVLSKPSDGSVP